MQAWAGKGDFAALLKTDPQVQALLRAAEIDELFDLSHHTRHVDEIFSRVFGET
jgi:adenylosuccinate lyase